MTSVTFRILGHNIPVSQKELNLFLSSTKKGARFMQYTAIGCTVIGLIGLVISNSRSPLRLGLPSPLLNYLDDKLRDICNIENSRMGQIADGTLRKIRDVRNGFITTFCNPENPIGELYLLFFIGGVGVTISTTGYLYGLPKLHQILTQALEVKASRS